MLSNVRHLIRSLTRSPAASLAAVLTWAFTLGVGLALFALLDAVLLTPLPFADPDALVVVGERPVNDPAAAPRAVTTATLNDWRDRSRGVFSQMEAFDPTNVTLTGLGSAERMSASFVTPDFFPLLGVSPTTGRTFRPEDAAARVVVISGAFWRTKLGSDPQPLGRPLVIGGITYTIVGVLPERFTFGLNPSDFWLPLPAEGPARAAMLVRVLGRLAPGRSVTDAALSLHAARRPSDALAVAVVPLKEAIVGGAAMTLPLLLAAAALATILAVINLAGLLMVRAIDRGRELAIRSALGAGRVQLVKQLLLEAHALVALGALGGVLLALWITPVIGQLAGEQFGRDVGRGLALNWRAVGVLVTVALICAWSCGLAPALRAATQRGTDVLTRGATSNPGDRVLRRLFVVGELALAFVLLACVALVGRSLQHSLAVNAGFEPSNVLTMRLSLPVASYADAQRVSSFYRELQQVLSGRLGNDPIAIVDELPLTGDRGRSLVAATPAETGREAVMRAAGPRYFAVMGIPIVEGREFEAQDAEGVPLRAVISRSLARQLFANERAVGRQLFLSSARPVQIVGVVGDVKHRSLDEGDLPTLYAAASQQPSRSTHLIVRTTRPHAEILAVVRDEVARRDRELPVYAAQTLSDVVRRSPGVSTRRVLAVSFGGFAALALMVAAIGLFGVVAHDVSRRRHEFALRVALGAHPDRLLRSVMQHAASVIGLGVGIGVLLSVSMTGTLRGVLFGVGLHDPLTYVAVAVLLSTIAFIAALGPARRAARTDPMVILRGDQ